MRPARSSFRLQGALLLGLTAGTGLAGGPLPELACPPQATATLTSSVEGPNTWWACRRADGTPDGPSRLSFADGGLRVEGAYRAGQGHGAFRMWTSAWDGGVRCDTWKTFSPDGGLRAQTSYVDGAEHGPAFRWFDDGVLAETGRYVHGKKEGPWREYARSGALEQEQEFRDGQRDGRFRRFGADGGVVASGRQVAEGEYVDGALEGRWVERRGGANLGGEYRHGRRQGRWTEASPDGGTRTTEWADGLEGPVPPCPAGTQVVQRCVARCCDVLARWCETPDGGRLGPMREWDPDGHLRRGPRG